MLHTEWCSNERYLILSGETGSHSLNSMNGHPEQGVGSPLLMPSINSCLAARMFSTETCSASTNFTSPLISQSTKNRLQHVLTSPGARNRLPCRSTQLQVFLNKVTSTPLTKFIAGLPLANSLAIFAY